MTRPERLNFPETMREFAYIHEEGNIPEAMRNVPFLKSFNADQLDDLLYSSSIIECEEGDSVIKEGGSGSRIYILMSGAVDVVKKDEVLVTLTTCGDIFGELAALGDEMRSATVRARNKAFLLAVDQKFLQDIKPRSENPSFYAAFYEFLAKITAQRLKSTSEALTRADKEIAELKAELAAAKGEAALGT